MLNLDDKTLNELKELAKENNVKNISKLKKEDLVNVLKLVLNNDEKENTNKSPKENQNLEDDSQELSGYKLTNEGDQIVEGILDILPEIIIYQALKMYIFLLYK